MAEDRTIVLTRHFDCPPAVLFGAWTDPAALPRWFGPRGFVCTTQAIDIREGGEWLFTMTGMGMDFPNRHRWRLIRPHERLEFLMDAGEGSGPPNEVTVTFAPEAGGTRLTQVMLLPTAGKKAEAVGFGAVELGYNTLEKLGAFVGAASAP